MDLLSILLWSFYGIYKDQNITLYPIKQVNYVSIENKIKFQDG